MNAEVSAGVGAEVHAMAEPAFFPDLRGFDPPVESQDARLRRLRPMVIGRGLPDAQLLELADRLGGSEVLLAFTWRLTLEDARALTGRMPEGALREQLVEALAEARGSRLLVSGHTLGIPERKWLLQDPLALTLKLAAAVSVLHWDPELTGWLSRGGGEGANVGATLVAELIARDETLTRDGILRLCRMVAQLLDERK